MNRRWRNKRKANIPKGVRRSHPRIAEFADAMARNMTKAECAFYYNVRKQVRGITKQVPIQCFNWKIYIADFFIKRSKLVIEIDGDDHKRKSGYDDERTRQINGMGFKVIRFTNQTALTDPEYCASVLAQWKYHITMGTALTPDAASHEHIPSCITHTISP